MSSHNAVYILTSHNLMKDVYKTNYLFAKKKHNLYFNKGVALTTVNTISTKNGVFGINRWKIRHKFYK